MDDFTFVGLGAIALGAFFLATARGFARRHALMWGWDDEGSRQRFHAGVRRGLGIVMIVLGIGMLAGIGR